MDAEQAGSKSHCDGMTITTDRFTHIFQLSNGHVSRSKYHEPLNPYKIIAATNLSDKGEINCPIHV